MELWIHLAETAGTVIGFFANLLTVVLGVIALYAIFHNKTKLSLFFRLFITGMINERCKRVRETLTKLEGLDYGEKEKRAEILALFGQLSGQLKTLSTSGVSMDQVQGTLNGYIEKGQGMSEAKKRQLVHEIQGMLEEVTYAETQKLLEIGQQ